MKHLFANLWLLVLTLLLCSVIYPAILLGIGQLPYFKDKAEGSLLIGKDGKTIIGSKLEAQAFEDDRYFWPRPSAASYNGAASSASNYSANNPALRSRVERQLGTLLKFGPNGKFPGKMIGKEIEKWFAQKAITEWIELCENDPVLKESSFKDLPAAWFKDSDRNAKYVEMWKTTPVAIAWFKASQKDPAEAAKSKAEDLAGDFLRFFAKNYPSKRWPVIDEIKEKNKDTGQMETILGPLPGDDAAVAKTIRGFFYPMWRLMNPSVHLDPVPADMVTTSGSGLDPHITLKSANYQFDRVADAWEQRKKPMPHGEVVRRLRKLVDEHKYAPLHGLAGVDMVNVMELNAALAREDW